MPKTKNSFMQLIPRKMKVNKSEYINQTDIEVDWEQKYLELQCKTDAKIRKLENELREAYELIEALDESVKVSDKLITLLEDKILNMTDSVAEKETPFDHGVGISICDEPKFYHISNGKHVDTMPKNKFIGVDIEFQPNRGFRIAPKISK